MMSSYWKNILLAILVAYVAIDLMASYVTGLKHNGALAVFAHLGSAERRGKAVMVILFGAVIGYFTHYYVAREGYNSNPENMDDQYTNGSLQDVDAAFVDNVSLLH